MRLTDVIALGGGEAVPAVLEDVLTPTGALAVRRGLDLLRSDAEKTAPDGRCPSIVIVNSNSMVCRARRLDGGDSVVVIPLGILARARALARRLFCLGKPGSRHVRFVGTVVDPRPDWEVAPGLAPVFGEQVELDGERQWLALKAFDAEMADETYDEMADDVMEIALHYLVGHELAHLYAWHDKLLELARAGDRLIPQGMSVPVLRRGLEVHADLMAAMTVASRFATLLPVDHSKVFEHWEVVFARRSFATALLFGMYDTHRKSLREYDDGSYPHPIIRFELTDWMTSHVIGSAAPDILDVVKHYSHDGWFTWEKAINLLELDCRLGRYGYPPDGDVSRCTPVTTLKYGIHSFVLPRRIQEEYHLGRQVAALAEKLEA